jgi:multidrug/hemolysin transport system permease protein
MSLVTFAAAEIYIVASGGAWLDAVSCLKIVLLIFLSTLMNTSLVCFIVSFINSNQAFSTVSTIIGTLIGFFTAFTSPLEPARVCANAHQGVFPPHTRQPCFARY